MFEACGGAGGVASYGLETTVSSCSTASSTVLIVFISKRSHCGLIPHKRTWKTPVGVSLSMVCVIRDQGSGFYGSKSIELYITIWNTHTETSSNLWRWSWVGSCVLGRLMKASHLEDRSDAARPDCFQRRPNDLRELKHQRSLPPRNLPLIFSCSLWALGYSVAGKGEVEEEEEEAASCLMFSSSILSSPPGSLKSHRKLLSQMHKCEEEEEVAAELRGWHEEGKQIKYKHIQVLPLWGGGEEKKPSFCSPWLLVVL